MFCDPHRALARCPGRARRAAVVAITHGEVIKAAVVHALGAPVLAFWRIDASPLAFTELHAHGGRWTVTRLNCASEAAGGMRQR